LGAKNRNARRWLKLYSRVQHQLEADTFTQLSLSPDVIPATSVLSVLRGELVSVIEFDASWEPTAKGLATEDLIDDLGRMIREIDSELDPSFPQPA